LTVLNVKNGQNVKLTNLVATSNPSLTCIQVDDTSASHQGWVKDTTANYNNDCGFPSGFKEITNDEVKIYPNPVIEELYFSQVSNATIYNTLGEMIGNWKEITSIDMSKFVAGMYVVIFTNTNGGEIRMSKIRKN